MFGDWRACDLNMQDGDLKMDPGQRDIECTTYMFSQVRSQWRLWPSSSDYEPSVFKIQHKLFLF